MDILANSIVVIGTVEEAEVLDNEELSRIMGNKANTVSDEPKRSDDGAAR